MHKIVFKGYIEKLPIEILLKNISIIYKIAQYKNRLKALYADGFTFIKKRNLRLHVGVPFIFTLKGPGMRRERKTWILLNETVKFYAEKIKFRCGTLGSKVQC